VKHFILMSTELVKGKLGTTVVYHLHGETIWPTVCANEKKNLPNGKFCLRLVCTICAFHSNLQRES